MQRPEDKDIDRSDTDKFWTTERIYATIMNIQKALKEKMSIQQSLKNKELLFRSMKRRFDGFESRYPTLFRLVVTQGYDLDKKRLSDVLSMYEKVRINQIEEYDASVRDGYDLDNHFVSPNLKDEKEV